MLIVNLVDLEGEIQHLGVLVSIGKQDFLKRTFSGSRVRCDLSGVELIISDAKVRLKSDC